MKKMLKKSKGFTLVELLIVIIIIGILAGMMMLSTGSATDKAEATKIVANLRNIKSACLLYYADNGEWPSKDIIVGSGTSFDKYLDQTPTGYTVKANGTIVSVDADGSKTVPSFTTSSGIYTKLQAMSKDAGLTFNSAVVTMPVRK